MQDQPIKIQILLHAEESNRYTDFMHSIYDEIIPMLKHPGIKQVKVSVTEQKPPWLTVIPFSKIQFALLSIWCINKDVLPTNFNKIIKDKWNYDCHGYCVKESIPVKYKEDWEQYTYTPGIGMITVFSRKPGQRYEDFMQCWHGSHTPLSLEIHPLFSYIRNEVLEELWIDTPHVDAIVEEHFHPPNQLLNPFIFFKGPIRMIPNMIRVWKDINTFIDIKRMKNYYIREKFVGNL